MDTPIETGDNLEALLASASAEPPESRIEFRDRLAHYGDEVILAIERWLHDEKLGGFAVRVIERAAPYSAPGHAASVLQRALPTIASRVVARDVADSLSRLRPLITSLRQTRRLSSSASSRRPASISPEDLVLGQVYRRRELHLQGLGGNRQSGISYPADGTYVLLFSDPDSRTHHGYVDRWSGDQYIYCGQWTGTGDMVFEVGNRAILDRSGELYLFVKGSAGYRFEGGFRLVSHQTERTVRDGRELTAIVFVLEPY